MIANLKQLRTEKNISQQQLAALLNVSQQSINKYENHETEPNLDTLISMADYFDTSVDYLIGRTNIRHKIEHINTCDLNDRELVLFDYYRQLSEQKRICLENVARTLAL